MPGAEPSVHDSVERSRQDPRASINRLKPLGVSLVLGSNFVLLGAGFIYLIRIPVAFIVAELGSPFIHSSS